MNEIKRIYRDIPNHEERAAAIPKNETNRRGFLAFWRSLRNLANLIGKSLESQRFFAVSAVFSGTTLFAVLYQTWYWNAILKLSYPFSIRFAFYFASIGIYLMIFWRGIWTLFVAVRVVARKFIWMRAACYLATAAIVLFQIPALILTVEYAPDQDILTVSDLQSLVDAIESGVDVRFPGAVRKADAEPLTAKPCLDSPQWRALLQIGFSFLIFIAGFILAARSAWTSSALFIAAYLIAGFDVILETAGSIRKGD